MRAFSLPMHMALFPALFVSCTTLHSKLPITLHLAFSIRTSTPSCSSCHLATELPEYSMLMETLYKIYEGLLSFSKLLQPHSHPHTRFREGIARDVENNWAKLLLVARTNEKPLVYEIDGEEVDCELPPKLKKLDISYLVKNPELALYLARIRKERDYYDGWYVPGDRGVLLLLGRASC